MPSSIRALLEGIVDYAGTYPPASLPLDAAIAEYQRARRGPDAWLLGRLVLPADALGDPLAAFATEDDGASPWRLSAVLSANPLPQLDSVRAFNERRDGAVVAAVEFPPVPVSDIHRFARAAGEDIERFFEVPLDGEMMARLDAIREARAFAKVRTGGVAAAAFPSAPALAAFLADAARRSVAFKATAGLHHAIRSCYPLTYEPGSATGVMHGFLNVAMAAVMARGGTDRDTIAGVLEDTSAEAFEFGPHHVSWRASSFPRRDLAEARQFFRSFGSCSIREPVAELAGLKQV